MISLFKFDLNNRIATFYQTCKKYLGTKNNEYLHSQMQKIQANNDNKFNLKNNFFKEWT